MKPISHKTLLERSQNARNAEIYYKLANKEALEELGFSNTGELREIKEIKVEPYKVGVFNLLRQVLP